MDSLHNKNKTEGVGEREEMAGASSASVEGARDVMSRPQTRTTSGDRDRSPVIDLTQAGPSTEGSPVLGLRTRSGRRLPPAPITSDDGDESDCSFVSLPSGAASRSSSKKRGRPPTTGEYVGLAEAKRRYVEAHEAEQEVREVEAILDPSVPPRKPGKGTIPLPDEADLARDYRQRPTADIVAHVLESMDEVTKVAGVSKGLKGNLARRLRIISLDMRAVMSELACRSASDATRQLEAENHELRGQMAELRSEVARLREAVEGQQQRPRTPPKQPLAARIEAARAMPPHEEARKASPMATSPVRQPPAIVLREEPIGANILDKIGSLIDSKLESFRKEQGLLQVTRSEEAADKKAAGPSKRQRRRKKEAAAATTAAAPKAPQPPKKTDPRPTQAEKPATKPPTEEWAKVVGRKERRNDAAAKPAAATKPPTKPVSKGKAGQGQGNKGPAGTTKKLPGRPPRTAAVTVTVPAGGKVTYAEVMSTAKSKIDLATVGITALKIRRAITGALVLEIPGPEGGDKADKLAARMSEVLKDSGVKVARPTKHAEIRVRGLDDSITPKDVAAAIAAAGGCRVEEIQTGEIRSSSTSLGTLWVRCPAAAARKLAIAGKVAVGWTQAKVEPLQARPLQCYRCLEMGHTRQRCTNEADRSGRCYLCGDLGHRASACKAASPKCAVCADQGRPAGHRLGSRACKAATGKKAGKGRKNAGPTAAAPAKPVAEGTPATAEKVVAEKPPVAAPEAATGMDTTA